MQNRLRNEIDSTSHDDSVNSEQVTHERRKVEKELAEERDQKLCVVCQVELRKVVLRPCTHLCLCEGCLEELKHGAKKKTPKCPVCRKDIERDMVVFW